MSQPQRPFIDPANELLMQVPARLDTGSVATPDGRKLGVLTIRTGSTTLTVFLGAEDLRTWAQLLTDVAGQLSGKLVPASPLDVSLLRARGNGHPG